MTSRRVIPAGGFKTIHLDAAPELDVDSVPNMATIAFESKRAHTVRQAHDRVDPDVFAESELRHHKVLSIRSDIDLGNTNAEIAKQLARLNEKMDEKFEKLGKEIKDHIQDLKLELGAKSDATIARTFNQMDLE
ncbi:hypothetical protein OROMI_000650 [Orobanche minor]